MINRLNGFSPVGTISGAPYNGATRRFYKAAGTTVTHDLFVGDLVVMSGAADAAGIPGVVAATAGDQNPACGVIAAIAPDPNHLDRASWIDGADAGYVDVVTDPNVVFEAQINAALAAAEVGKNVNMVATAAGSRTAGSSGQEINATGINTTATFQLKLIGFVNRADNAPNGTYNRGLVIINNHQFKGGTGTVGV
jgi:hypothetical protein